MAHDYSEYQDKTSSEDALGRLSNLAELQAQQEAAVVEKEKELKAAQEELRNTSERLIPDLMDEIGLSTVKTKSGLTVIIDESLHASIPKEKSDEAFTWLIDHKHEDLIKNKIGLAFGKEEAEAANDFIASMRTKLREMGLTIKIDQKREVHHSTLKAWVKEQLQAGIDIPIDLFGVFKSRKAKIS